MSVSPKSHNVNPADAMAQIAWLDTVERLDTLLLEIRHFQCNVIFSLRLPILYQALRFEECYLWGRDWPYGHKNEENPEQVNSWFDSFRDMRSPTLQLRELADTWIIPFPILPEKIIDGNTIREKIARNILEIVQYTISSGRWNRDALRHYRNLSVLQILKSNVLHDKLVLCHEGYHTFGKYIKNPELAESINYKSIAEFMIIRSAVTMRLNDYVGRFGDLQAQFDTSLDLSLQEDPAPMINRRNEQGFYTSFMSLRCKEVQDAIDDLLSHLCAKPLHEPPQIMHRWRHDFTSTTEYLYDDVGQVNKNGPDNKGKKDKERRRQINTQFINSSFWMPDRPDLLSSLAHELAHNNVYERYDDAWLPSLDINDDKFARLLKLLNSCFDRFRINHHNPTITPIDYPESSLIEISCDLIAASVEGHAYLYALFLEITACGDLAYLLEAPKKRFDLDIRPDQYIVIDPNTISRSWYYRLKLLCAWMEEIYHHDSKKDNLISIMIAGINGIADGILNHISDITPGTGKNSLKFWQEFTNRLCTITSRSETLRLVRKWRKERSEYWHDTLKSTKKGQLHLFPNYSRPLNVHVQNYLFRILLNVKQKPGRLLYQHRQQPMKILVERFCQNYFDIKNEEYDHFSKNFLCSTENLILGENSLLFRHIYDIPWRCAIFSAIDFIHRDSKSSEPNNSNWLDIFHHKSALGRELYSVALEFYLSQTTDRLAISARVVRRLLDDEEIKLGSELREKLGIWLYNEIIKNDDDKIEILNKNICDLQKNIKTQIEMLRKGGDSIINREDKNNFFLKIDSRHDDINHLIEKHGALAWHSMENLLVSPEITNDYEERIFKSVTVSLIEKFIGYKINKLLEIIKEEINKEEKNDTYHILNQLKMYLELWKSKDKPSEIDREKTILSLLLSPIVRTVFGKG